MIFRASLKWAGAGLYDLTFSAVILRSKGLVKCLIVPASRSLSTFDRIPSVCFLDSSASEGLVSRNGVHVGNALTRKSDWASGRFQPIFLETLRLAFAKMSRYNRCDFTLSILRSSRS